MRFGIIVYAFIPINGNVSLSIIVLLVRCYTVESVTRMNGVVCLCFWWSVVLVSQGVDLSWSCLVQCLEYMLRDLLSLPHGQAADGIMLSFICMCAFSWRYHVELNMHVCVQLAVSCWALYACVRSAGGIMLSFICMCAFSRLCHTLTITLIHHT